MQKLREFVTLRRSALFGLGKGGVLDGGEHLAICNMMLRSPLADFAFLESDVGKKKGKKDGYKDPAGTWIV